MGIEVLKRQLGLRLKELRLNRGLRQEDLEKWGFSYRYYGKMERGLVNPTLDTLLKLCEIFEVTLSDLFAFMNGDEFVSEEREAIALKIAEILKREDKAKIGKLRIFLDEIL
ncbi:MAG TPA: helix-turn-helix transcriptional regulator [Syntrophales bacterium]|nr:helix-turn-helix transcriptional regulator [Syntrophales bacterium]